MSQGIENAVVIDGGGDVVGLMLEGVDGVAHRDANASLENHRGVVAAVAEGHCATGVKTLVAGHRQDAFALVGTVGGDISVDEVLDSAQIGENQRRTARCDIHSRTVGLGLCQRKDGRCRNPVRLETYECAVDVEE